MTYRRMLAIVTIAGLLMWAAIAGIWAALS